MYKNALVFAVGFGAMFAGCSSDNAGDLTDTDSHAREVYGHYQDAAGGKVQFEVSTVESGRLLDVLDRSVNELVSVPGYRLTMEEQGTEITAIKSQARDSSTDEWAQPVLLSKFDDLGRDTGAASYRILSVNVNRGGELSAHRALQVCWDAGANCLVMDPVVERLESFAEDRARLLAEGWKVESQVKQLGGEVQAQAVCTLSSNFNAVSRSLTWASRTITYKNLYGITVVTHRLGSQQTGISCYVSSGSCRAATFGYSSASSCDANLGFNCDCSNTGNQSGTSTNAARAWSETKCEHKNVLQGSANVSWSRSGVGAGFNISWSTSGGTVNANGGTQYDTCAWH